MSSSAVACEENFDALIAVLDPDASVQARTSGPHPAFPASIR